jgi:hypothetical protein
MHAYTHTYIHIYVYIYIHMLCVLMLVYIPFSRHVFGKMSEVWAEDKGLVALRVPLASASVFALLYQ